MAGPVSTIAIRPMAPEDVATVAALEAAIYPDPWSPVVFAEELEQANRSYVIAENDRGEVVGYAGLMMVGQDAHVTTLAVSSETRGRGLGTRLMLELARTARGAGAHRFTLEVRMSNHAAQALYRRFGFAPVGVRKSYYRDEDALVMWATGVDGAEYEARLHALEKEVP